jgi:hypothetical protein
MMMKANIFFYFIVLLFPFCLHAQDATQDSSKSSDPDSAEAWAFGIEADYYLFPTEANILPLILTADKGIVHLEARYNYEDRYSASVLGGLNFSFGKKLNVVLTPVAGIVFGRLSAAIAGLETDLNYKRLNFNSQTEWVIDFAGNEGNYIYTFDQLGMGITDHLVLGLTAQRTRLYETKLDLQRGIFAQYSFGKWNLSFSYFNPFSTSYFFLPIVSFDF